MLKELIERKIKESDAKMSSTKDPLDVAHLVGVVDGLFIALYIVEDLKRRDDESDS